MIPTTVTSSSLSTPSPSTPTTVSSSQQNLTVAFKGIAALILEGRAIAEDEFQALQTSTAISTRPSPVVVNAGAYKDHVDHLSLFHTSSSSGGRRSPGPSTSRAAASSTFNSTTSRHVINITTNPHVFGCLQSPPFDDVIEDSSFAETTTRQRWTQKLCQLRQASPATTMSRDCGHYEQQVAIEVAEPEIVALAINSDTANADKAGDYEIVRRVVMNRSNLSNSGGSASSSPGSTENFLHSLQSLATTCLRGASPAVETGLRYMSPNTAAFGSIGAPKNSILRGTPPPAPRCSYPFVSDVPGSASSSGSGIQSPYINYTWSPQPIASVASGSGSVGTRCNRRDQFKRESAAKDSIATPTSTRKASKTVGSSSKSMTVKSAAIMSTSTYPQQGPHCEQFLRKMGLAKGDVAEAEEHFCDMSYVNITCSRWRAYCSKMEAIIQSGDPVCIEVYLGPVRHKILLEQWILTQKDKAPPPNMTLPSLCSAIRSQLYFSQISAWCDLIKKSDKTIFDTERVIFPTPTGAAGDLAISNTSTTATTTAASGSASTSPNSASPPSLLLGQRRPRLNIFYRIKQYDSTACFNTKPNVHNFPSVIIGDGCSISVCLKSLPRINGGIPKLGAAGATSNGTAADLKTNTTASAFEGVVSTPPTAMAMAMAMPTTSREELTTTMATAASPKTNCDIQKAGAAAADSVLTSSNISSFPSSDCVDSQNKSEKCMFFIDEEDLPADEQTYDDDDDDYTNGSFAGDSSNSSFSCSLSHREKQLLKYRKRMLKRDKKTTRKGSLTSVQHATSNGNRAQPMEQGDEEEQQDQEELKTKYNARNSHPERPPSGQVSKTQNSSNRPDSNSHSVAMVSTGTQTQSNCYQCGSEKALICLTCDSSSSSSNFKGPSIDDMDSMDSCSISSSDIIHTPRNNAELLLQAIQRTPKAAKKNKKQALRTSPPGTPSGNGYDIKESNHVAGSGRSKASKPESQNRLAGCQLCKRQKTQHNFGSESNGVVSNSGATEDSEEIACDEDDEEDDGRGDVVAVTPVTSVIVRCSQQKPNAPVILEKECFITSTKLTPYIDKCSLNNNKNMNHVAGMSSASVSTDSATKSLSDVTKIRFDEHENNTTANNRSCTPPNNNETATTTNTRFNGNSAPLLFNCEGSFKTPPTTNAQQQSIQHYQQHKQTPKPTLLQFSAPYHGGAAGDGNEINGGICNFPATPPSALHNPMLLRKGLPKVNLTPIFCNPSATATVCHSSCFTSSPIPISSCPSLSAETTSFCFDHVTIVGGGAHSSTTTVDSNNITVQKSYSAPALPNSTSPSLSPRFSKQAAIYKRRSRHLSDRSDRSSLGSDEQISDEDLECAAGGLYSPATSPMKMRSRTAALFGGRALLGNLEESLLQRRLMPKVEVFGFKVLLGASGVFCPTQLTIPAATYFYELRGAALSTPYVCEIRLPRKGYSVPRAGTVQATLLNPMGTVVRMFVIPYDMRDMPPLHQTFIRQRVLAEASSNEVVEVDKNAALGCLGSVASGSSSNNNYHNNNSVDYQNGVANGFCTDAVASNKDCTNNATNYTNNNSSNFNNNNNNNNTSNSSTSSTSANNKYRLSPNGGLHGNSNLGHFISAEHMKRLRYSIHLRFQTSRSGRLSLHTDIRLLISRRTDCDTAAAHAKGVLEAPNDLVTDTVMPSNPKYSSRQENPSKI